MTQGIPAVEQALREVPGWARADIDVRPIPGGITHRSYVVEVDGRAYDIRVPGERTELLGVDRANEAEAAERAAALGIGPRVVGRLPRFGTLITEHVSGQRPTGEQLLERLAELIDALRRFHQSGPVRGTFPVHRVVEWHVREAGSHGVIAPSSYERLHQQSRRIEHAFAAAPMPTVPCHNHLVASNIVVGERVWLLGFEFAGMNDVFFDLAEVSAHAGFGPAEDDQLIRGYFGTSTRAAFARLQLMKVMSAFRQGTSGVVQQAVSTMETDFREYADERLRHCEQLVASPSFEHWLEDARRPPLPPSARPG